MSMLQRIALVMVSTGWLMCPVLVEAGDLMSVDTVRKLVEDYCQAEFVGIRDLRFEFVKFSPQRDAREKARDPQLGGHVIDWDGDPLFVVASYQILNVKVDKGHAVATIVYKRLARSRGDGVLERILIRDYRERDIVKLHLTHDSTRWWVFDPPLPRISKMALIDFYEGYFGLLGDKWLQRSDLSEAQKQHYHKRQETLKFLKEL